MYLVTAATSMEMEAFTRHWSGKVPVRTLVTGVGPVETTLRVALHLAAQKKETSAVLNIGIGGAYIRREGAAGLLDLCLAQREVLGDFGICYEDRVEPLEGPFVEMSYIFDLDRKMTEKAGVILERQEVRFHRGTFVTVNGVSATAQRGAMLAGAYDAICENMEGAAVARVCKEFSIPMLELRCISNMVEDRNRKNWKIKEAVQRCGVAAASIIGGFTA